MEDVKKIARVTLLLVKSIKEIEHFSAQSFIVFYFKAAFNQHTFYRNINTI